MVVRKWSVAVLGMWLGWSSPGYSQPAAPGDMRQLPAQFGYQPASLAQTISRTLKESGHLSRYSVNVTANGGVVDLVGEVSDDNQRAIVLTLARSTPGVTMV